MKRIVLAVAMTLAVHAESPLLNPQTYWGMCDASAGVALDNDHFAVADDEGNILRVYKRGEPRPTHEFDVGRFLTTHHHRKAETDLEGGARIGNRVYWISSHGLNREGEPAPNRRKFFATEIEGKHGRKLVAVGDPYTGLLDDLLATDKFKKYGLAHAALLAPKHKGGLNIEGMCAREDGALLIAFRNPVPKGKGLIVPLLNPDEVIHGKRAKFGDMIELDLGGFGIRDISQASEGYLIIAGPTDGKKVFHLYWWDGKTSAPIIIPGAHFEGLNPEAIFRFPNDPPGVFQILSDDGSRRELGVPCKQLPQDERHFRAGELHIDIPKPQAR